MEVINPTSTVTIIDDDIGNFFLSHFPFLATVLITLSAYFKALPPLHVHRSDV